MGLEEQWQPDAEQVDGDIQAVIDRSEARLRFMITDTATDDAWIAMAYAEAPFLHNWK